MAGRKVSNLKKHHHDHTTPNGSIFQIHFPTAHLFGNARTKTPLAGVFPGRRSAARASQKKLSFLAVVFCSQLVVC